MNTKPFVIAVSSQDIEVRFHNHHQEDRILHHFGMVQVERKRLIRSHWHRLSSKSKRSRIQSAFNLKGSERFELEVRRHGYRSLLEMMKRHMSSVSFILEFGSKSFAHHRGFIYTSTLRAAEMDQMVLASASTVGGKSWV